MTTHTPGPWRRNIKPASKYPTIFAGEAPKHTHVAHVSTSGLSEAEIEGNCQLITAAPELLWLVERAHTLNNVPREAKWTKAERDRSWAHWETVRAATLAKLEG